MATQIRIQVHKSLYLRDPEDTELGRKIQERGILLIDKLGMEKFTFKKLAEDISSTEASMYRYFESKHQFLSYLLAWYWNRISYLINVRCSNISDPKTKLRIAIEVLTESAVDDPATPHVDEAALHRIIVTESSKWYNSKMTKSEKAARIEAYQELTEKIAGFVREMKPKYKYSKALVITCLLAIQRQTFFAEHFPELTELSKKSDSKKEIRRFVEELLLSATEA